MSHIKRQLGHPNIADVVLKRMRKYCGKKTKNITEEEIARCKLPEATELRKN